MKYLQVLWCITIILLRCGRVADAESERPEIIIEENHLRGDTSVSAVITDSDYAIHMDSLEQKIPDGFTVLIKKPFVVIGDESPSTVKHRAERTIQWAVDLLKHDYFTHDPAYIIDIWLFKDKQSYRKYSKELFGDEPTTPFGYYSEDDRALIMNISTGGGTLVHEIVHPFVRANFPGCPPWFDEGLASLYEQCGERNGHIYGYTNWRLEGIQETIRCNEVPSFKTLTSMTPYTFYTQDKGSNYGQARYLCYYLQEKGLLRTFYHEFLENKDNDPTGYKTLQKVLRESDMDAFKKKWEKFVLNLTFP
jgi:hypothetical protein